MLSAAPDAHAANVAALEEKLSAKESIISQLNSQLEESNQNFENFMIRSTTQTKKSAKEIEVGTTIASERTGVLCCVLGFSCAVFDVYTDTRHAWRWMRVMMTCDTYRLVHNC